MKISPYDGMFYLNQAKSLDELSRIFERLISAYGFDLFAVQSSNPELTKKRLQPNFLSNFSKEWTDHYYSSRYYEIDPVITVGKGNRAPYLWTNLWNNIEMSDQQIDFFKEAEKFNVSSGLGFPIFQSNTEPGIVSFASTVCRWDELEQIFATEHLVLALWATCFHNTAQKFFDKIPASDAPVLTKREKECLVWAAAGKTDPEIGDILNISFRTVNMHMYTSYKKLDAVSREQAVVKALLAKLIDV